MYKEHLLAQAPQLLSHSASSPHSRKWQVFAHGLTDFAWRVTNGVHYIPTVAEPDPTKPNPTYLNLANLT